MVYCFKCPTCGRRYEFRDRDERICENTHRIGDDITLRRDYAAEGVGVGSGVRVSRDGTVLDQARQVLPDNADFKGPGDPDGTRGMRKWHETFEPKEGNTRPVAVGNIDRRVF